MRWVYLSGEVFAAQFAADRVPAFREIHSRLNVDGPRTQRLRHYLATEAERLRESYAQ